jgi:deoxyribonuclease V
VKIRKLHPWKVTTSRARDIQIELRSRVSTDWTPHRIHTVAGSDVGFPDRRTVRAAVVVMSYPRLEVLEALTAEAPCPFPYVPGLLSFREVPVLAKALEAVREEPDVLLCDAHGMAHPRRMGLASHLGVLLERPVIGCAKSVLVGTFDPPGRLKGEYSYMYDGDEVIGVALRTRDGVTPVYVSVGNLIDLDAAVDIALGCTTRYRIPEPLRIAHRVSVGGGEGPGDGKRKKGSQA